MKSVDIKTTEILGQSITPQAEEVWKRERRGLNRALTPYLILCIFSSLVNISMLVGVSFLLESFIAGIEAGSVNYGLVGMIAAVLLVRAVGIFFENNMYERLILRTRRYLYVRLFEKALCYDLLLQKAQSGDLINILGADVSTFSALFADVRVKGIICALQTAAVLGTIYYFSWAAGLIVTIFYPIYLGICSVVTKRLERASYTAALKWSAVSQTRLKGIQGWQELAILKKQHYYTEKFDAATGIAVRKSVRQANYTSLFTVFASMAQFFVPIVCVVLATLPILGSAALPVSTALAVYMLAGYLDQPLMDFTGALSANSQNKALRQRMSDVLYFDDGAADDGKSVGDILSIDINIDEYSYVGEEKLLQECRLHVERGDLVAVRGDSGCGKSTLFKLLIKQNDYAGLQGSITYNGIPVQELSRGSFYEKLQYVSQNYFVFEDTLYNNLCMGEPYSDEELARVIGLCCLEEFVAEYGMDMVLTEDGKNISQGQLQRICIARALLRKPQCLLLDEPTSALDETTGIQLMENLVRYAKECRIIMFVISHKQELAGIADKNIFLKKNQD